MAEDNFQNSETIQDWKSLLENLEEDNLSDEEKELISQVKFRFSMIDYLEDDPILIAHMYSRINEAFVKKNLKVPIKIADYIEKQLLQLRHILSEKILEKKKEYDYLEQKYEKSKPLKKETKKSIWDNDNTDTKNFDNNNSNGGGNGKDGIEALKIHLANTLNPITLNSNKIFSSKLTSGSEQNNNYNTITNNNLENNYMDYEEALDFLEKIELQKGIKLGLDNMSKALAMFGNPQENYKIIHVTGTNGKGSVCAMIDTILQSASFKVGRYTSPHLVKLNERFMINSKEISDSKLAELVNRIAPFLNKVELTYFEILTLIAFLYFQDEKVDFVVLEVGMGGRLDATNVSKPLIGIITNIDFDHMQHLGNTIKEIAFEKAGIIKEGMLIVTGSEGEALDVIKNTCTKRNAKLLPLFKHKIFAEGITIGPTKKIHVGLKGEFQLKNAEIAYTAINALKAYNIEISERAIKIGLADADWPGRLDFVEDNVLLDSAHNPAGIKVLVKELEIYKKRFEKIILVFGAMKDKDTPEMILRLIPLAEQVFLTKANTDRAQDPEILGNEIEKYKHKYVLTKSVRDAIEQARAIAGPKDLVVVTGSIYIVGEAMAYFKSDRNF